MPEAVHEIPPDLDASVVALMQDALFADEIQRGVEQSPVVKFILLQAKAAEEEAIGMLVDADPTEMKEIMRLQNEVKRFRDMRNWIDQVIERGANAFEQLKRREHEDTPIGD